MGQPIIRLGDKSIGHPPWGPNAPIVSSTDVFVNSIGVVRLGDDYAVHSNGPSPHPEKALSNSSTVYVNGKLVQRTGDPCSCGDTAGPGSQNVFAG